MGSVGGDPFAALLRPDLFDAYPVDSSTFAPVAYANDGTATEPASSSFSSQQRPAIPIPFLNGGEADSLPQPSQGRSRSLFSAVVRLSLVT